MVNNSNTFSMILTVSYYSHLRRIKEAKEPTKVRMSRKQRQQETRKEESPRRRVGPKSR